MENEEKILTRWIVEKLGLDKLEVITSDMLDGYTRIGDYAFWYCSSLTSVTIPNSITSIGVYAFGYCDALISINIPDSVINIGGWAFEGCTSLPVEDNLRYADTYLVEAVDKSLSTYIIKAGTKWIGSCTFYKCYNLISIKIPDSIISIELFAFGRCDELKSIVIGDKTYKTQEVVDGKCKAYKAFEANMTCRDFQYEEGKTYEIKGIPILCEYGFHACLRLTDVFKYYNGKFGGSIVVHEVELEGVSECATDDSKVVAKKITIGKRIL